MNRPTGFHVIEIPDATGEDPAFPQLYSDWLAQLNTTFRLGETEGQPHGRVGLVPHHTRIWWPETMNVYAIAVFAETLSRLYGHAFLHMWVPADPTGDQPATSPAEDTVIETYVNGVRVLERIEA